MECRKLFKLNFDNGLYYRFLGQPLTNASFFKEIIGIDLNKEIQDENIKCAGNGSSRIAIGKTRGICIGRSADGFVMFTSDNGAHGGQTLSRPLRGAKGMYYEGGIRVPMIIKWPGVVDREVRVPQHPDRGRGLRIGVPGPLALHDPPAQNSRHGGLGRLPWAPVPSIVLSPVHRAPRFSKVKGVTSC